ncbi:MAG: hypothetical protein RIC06_01005 [Cyclobacteriaceae bacterium]
MKNKFKISILLCLGLFITSCDKEDINKQPSFTFGRSGLEGRIINELSMTSSGIIAATDKGLYVKTEAQNSLEPDNWESAGLAEKNIRTFVEIDEDLWLAAENAGSSFFLYQSKNQGETWAELENNFGGDYEQHINDLEYVAETQMLYAVGYGVLAESADMGQTWTPIIGDWDWLASGLDFVEKNPESNELWIGGQNAIEGFILYKYDLDSEEETLYMNLVEMPSTAKSILFNPDDPDHVIVGAEGGIISTSDGGNTWNLIKDDHESSKFYFGLARDEFKPEILYAAGWLKDFDNPQKLILSYSKDNGSLWQEVTYPDNDLFGGVYDMLSTVENGQQVLYLGLYKGGVYKVNIGH